MKEVIKKRKSVRHFQNQEVPAEILEEVVALARLAPSAGAIKGYRWVFTKERSGNVEAPMYMIICANPDAYAPRYGDRGKDLYAIQDATIFGTYIQLILTDMGLASCWVGAFREGRAKRVNKLEENLKPIVVIAFGYAL